MKSHDRAAQETSCHSCDRKRRLFLQMLAAGAGAVLIGGCGDESSSAPAVGTSYRPIAAEIVGKEFRVSDGASLQPGEAYAFVLPDQSPGIVFRAADNSFKALSARCTHSGCLVEWREKEIFCPCHGSKFDPNGKVLSGPATKPLPTMKVRQEGNDVFVSM